MNMQERVTAEMTQAAKGGDRARLSILRFALAALKNREKELRRTPSDEEAIQVLAGLVKKGKESIAQFKDGNRHDLVDKEQREIEILQALLPQQLTPEELADEISKVVEELGASTPKDLGKVMKTLMPKIAGRADGKMVSDMVRRTLSD
jgi:hypothetical protein